uniref:SMC5-SMC6 complex localization factor 1 n=1 Tax=Poecilia formosa TaxID=48698 RepID=A0A096LYQ0_POEFO
RMESCTHVFQISGIKAQDKNYVAFLIQQLTCTFIMCKVYKHCTTHLITPQVLPSEKFLAACAAGKWVVTPNYVLESMKNGSWLPEGPYEVAIFTSSSAAFYPVRQWREKVTKGQITGAFQGWRVLLMVQEPNRRAMFKRLLKAGRAEVYNCPPPMYTSITHVMAKPVTEKSKSLNSPCYPVSHIVQHLFGVRLTDITVHSSEASQIRSEVGKFNRVTLPGDMALVQEDAGGSAHAQSNRLDVNFNEMDDLPSGTKANCLDGFSNLEAELRNFAVKKETRTEAQSLNRICVLSLQGRPRLCFLEFLGYRDPHRPFTQDNSVFHQADQVIQFPLCHTFQWKVTSSARAHQNQIAIRTTLVFPFRTLNFRCQLTTYFDYPPALSLLLFLPSVSLSDLSNISSMIECGLVSEALDSIRSAVFPGVLPPATYLISLIEYAQQGNATSLFLRNFHQVMVNLLITNPSWLAQNSVKKYYAQVLQCPRCKMGLWPLLETAIRYCLTNSDTCHPHPGPALPALVHFYCDMLALCLMLLKGELHSVNSRDFMFPKQPRASSAPASGSLIYGTFWTVWERTTLLSCTVKKLLQLLTEAAIMEFAEGAEKRELYLADTLLDLLSVLVEFWCQQHFKLNQSLVEKGLKDLSEHLAILSQDLCPAVLVELVCRVHSTRLKLVVVDAIFRNLCCRNGFTVGDEPLSLKKIVCSYLPALGTLVIKSSMQKQKPKLLCASCVKLKTALCHFQSNNKSVTDGDNGFLILNTEILTFSLLFCKKNDQFFSCFRVALENCKQLQEKLNFAPLRDEGETLLHRACKRNQVETVLQILALPGTDVNVKDHAGWTPLHEACNHGSTECVRALLHHHPAPVLTDQVAGVSPLHDALLNGHLDIAKMLLEHAG